MMQVITHKEQGLFLKPALMEMSCSCQDWAAMCKHMAATMYGIDGRFYSRPELTFTLRKAARGELISAATELETAKPAQRAQGSRGGEARQSVRYRAGAGVCGRRVPGRKSARRPGKAVKSKRCCRSPARADR
jgi:uncharacterized Zn finger protein